MHLTRTSTLTGTIRTRELAVTPDQLRALKAGVPVAEALPQLSEADRRFVSEGITEQEWRAHTRAQAAPCLQGGDDDGTTVHQRPGDHPEHG